MKNNVSLFEILFGKNLSKTRKVKYRQLASDSKLRRKRF